MSTAQTSFAPGMYIHVRDEDWLVTKVDRVVDGYRLEARGVSEYVRDETAVFFDTLDDISIFNPSDVKVIADNDSPQYRRTRLFLESMLRSTPVPLYSEQLAVSTQMLADPLEYQLNAVRHALSAENTRPRVLIADAVGLGKTLEMGMILAELIRRGRGERILVVTPRHVMEQMQHELWTRFAIPLVRLDSQGIQRVRQMLPGSRNPFSYFPRVIVSMDTLKQAKYRAQLEKVRWDAVVIDEVHNATNVGTQNNELARALAPTTEALLLASATPHNGDAESFKELLRLLDPTSVLPDGTVDPDAIKRLVIRRHRHSPEVASVVGPRWAERKEPNNIHVEASPEEVAVADELKEVWINPAVDSPAKQPLQAWTLVKGFLSSPAALEESIDNRLERADGEEKTALIRLRELNEKITPKTSAKFRALVDYLQEIGIGPRSKTRVVVFSERVATLHWLRENLSKELKLKEDAVRMMHGGMPDHEQMSLIDEFKREDSPVRVLVTGDVASEGVNLHAQCHHLVHYDIPWSLIRIQQRNGRVDRYGQRYSPEITTLLLDPDNGSLASEVHVLSRLMEREFEAHEVLGDAGALMGEHSIEREEDAIRDVLRGKRDFDDAVRDPNQIAKELDGEIDSDDIDALLAQAMQALLSQGPEIFEKSAETKTVKDGEKSLFKDEEDYLTNALNQAFYGDASREKDGVSLSKPNKGVMTLTPPNDLLRLFRFLPQEYLEERDVENRLMLATNTDMGAQSLDNARSGDSSTTWPQAHFLGPLHPVTSWAVDRALGSLQRREIPAISGDTNEVQVLLMGTITNRRGQVISRGFVTTTHYQGGLVIPTVIDDPVAWLQERGLDANAYNDGNTDTDELPEDLIPTAVQQGSQALMPMLNAASVEAEERINTWKKRAQLWKENRETVHGTAKLARAGKLINTEASLADRLHPEDNPLVRPLVVVVPRKQDSTV